MINIDRINKLSHVLASLGFDNIIKFDLYEPEYRVLKRIYEAGIEPRYLALIAILAGINDYQLGKGGAEVYWETLLNTFEKFGAVNNLSQAEILMKAFLAEPINARFRNTKIGRLNKLFKLNFCRWLIENYEDTLKNPVMLWRRLALDLNNQMHQKTIVFAMKTLDLTNLIINGEYLPFPENTPIPVDFHTRNMAISTGIITEYIDDDEVREAWAKVARETSKILNKTVNLLRIDSIAWQLGKIAYKNNYKKEETIENIQKYLTETLKFDTNNANLLAVEFTKNMEKIKY